MHTTNRNVGLLNEEKEPMNTNENVEMSYQTSVDEVSSSNKDDLKKFWRFSIRDLILWYSTKSEGAHALVCKIVIVKYPKIESAGAANKGAKERHFEKCRLN